MRLDREDSPLVDLIEVRDLFGRYDYTLSSNDDDRGLIILYGDNGSGKTTILQLLFHLLSTAPTRGHRTALGQIPFRRFEVALTNGTRVYAERKESSGEDYNYGIKTLSGHTSANVTVDLGSSITGRRRQKDKLESVLSELKSAIAAEIYYIADDRHMWSDQIASERLDDDTDYFSHFIGTEEIIVHRGRQRRSKRDERVADDLETALDLALEWARAQALGATSAGTESTSEIYGQVIRRLAHLPREDDLLDVSQEVMLKKIAELEGNNMRYEPYGLAQAFAGELLREQVLRADLAYLPTISGVLQPYLESVEARQRAVSTLQETLETFVTWVNRFFRDKFIEFRLANGVVIYTDDGMPLSPDVLSSGERQLLHLLTSALYSRETPSLFLIDEPELSLNMVWQRRFLDALIDCAGQEATQMILATHSFEILTDHGPQVAELKPIPK